MGMATEFEDRSKKARADGTFCYTHDVPRECCGCVDVDPHAWRGCVAWKVRPGCGEACFGMCSRKQRAACKETYVAH